MADETEFSRTLGRLRSEAGLSLRVLGDRANYGKSYISELERAEKPPTPEVAERLDVALAANGALAKLVPARHSGSAVVTAARDTVHPGPLDGADVERLHETVRHLVALDTLHGSDGLASNAARAVATAQRRLAIAGVEPNHRSDLYASLAELGEVAAWLAFDSEQQEDSRRLANEALLNAQRAGDTAMSRFLTSHLSMQALYLDRPAEALDLAGRVLADDPRSKRVVGMMRVRRARALGRLRSTMDALKELERARVELDGGVGPDDPAWSWWWHDAELARHESHIMMAGGDGRRAVAASERAVALIPPGQGRDQALFRAGLLSDLVGVQAWQEAEAVAVELFDVASGVGSARVPRIVRAAERNARRAGAPAWVVEAMHEAAQVADPAA